MIAKTTALLKLEKELSLMFPANKFNNLGEKCKRVNKNAFLNIMFHNTINSTENLNEVKML